MQNHNSKPKFLKALFLNKDIRYTKLGLTLVELMISVVMFAILAVAATYIFRAVLLSWSSQETRAGIDISLDRGIEEMVRDLREAKEIRSTAGYDEIRFSHDQATYYIYYLYNAGDSYVPPPAFGETTYELRKATLTGDISTAFMYGSGQLIMTDVLPPTTSDLSEDPDNSNVFIIDLSITRGDEIIRSRTKVKPRNI